MPFSDNNAKNYKQVFYHQNIILSLYIASILVVGSITNSFKTVPVEFFLSLTTYPHLIEILMTNSLFSRFRITSWFGIATNALVAPYIISLLNYEVTLTGILFLLVSYQSLLFKGVRGWALTIFLTCIGTVVFVYREDFILIPQAPFQILIIAFTCSLFFIYYSAGNAYENLQEIKDKRRALNTLLDKNSRWVKVISRYLSPKIVNEIVNDKVTGNETYQRRPLTIFFSDVVGFTSISEKISTKELAYYLNDYLSEMSSIANKHGGTIDKFIGDGIMIFFGDPSSKGIKEDVSSAIDMAIEMQRAMTNINARWSRMNFKYKFNIRMGIHHGIATVGNFGSTSQLNYTAIGNNVNLAARLEQTSPQAGIHVSEQVKEIVGENYKFSASKSLKLKGISKPVDTFTIDYHHEEYVPGMKSPDGVSLESVSNYLAEIRRLRTED